MDIVGNEGDVETAQSFDEDEGDFVVDLLLKLTSVCSSYSTLNNDSRQIFELRQSIGNLLESGELCHHVEK